MKEPKCINFEKEVLEKVKDRARKEGTTVSNLVNMVCRQQILGDVNYYRAKAKEHYLKWQEFNYMKEQKEIEEETK